MATKGISLSAYDPKDLYRPEGHAIGICVAEWNEEITSGLLAGALEVLHQVMPDDRIRIHPVPGSFELPLGAQFLLDATDVSAVICIGSVIRGETAHFDFVCNAASEGILHVGLKYNAPVIFCVLTDDTIEQSRARSGGVHGNKGIEAAVSVLKMLGLKDSLNT